jgi:hypothetical protein
MSGICGLHLVYDVGFKGLTNPIVRIVESVGCVSFTISSYDKTLQDPMRSADLNRINPHHLGTWQLSQTRPSINPHTRRVEPD